MKRFQLASQPITFIVKDISGVQHGGTIPRGSYLIGPPKVTAKGPNTMKLTPVAYGLRSTGRHAGTTAMGPHIYHAGAPLPANVRPNPYGRENLLIHGDNKSGMHNASTGCIVYRLKFVLKLQLAETITLKSCTSYALFLYLVISAGVLCPFVYAQHGPKNLPIEPKAIIADISSYGARYVVDNELNADEGPKWIKVLNKIETGAPAWLDVGKKLAPGTDAGSGESLLFSFSIALTNNASGVLSRLGQPLLSVENVCQSPYIEAPNKIEVAYLVKARLALQKVTNPQLASQKKACLAGVSK